MSKSYNRNGRNASKRKYLGSSSDDIDNESEKIDEDDDYEDDNESDDR